MSWFAYFSAGVVSVAGVACLIVLACFAWDRAFTAVITQLKVKVYFCEYIWHRKEFRKWMKFRCAEKRKRGN
jgi:hypothetical protein